MRRSAYSKSRTRPEPCAQGSFADVGGSCYPGAMPHFECDKCGACCSGTLIVEAEELDLLREPRLIESDPHWGGRTAEAVLHELQSEYGRAIILACGRRCTFLGADNRCAIYPTRPNVCVAMQAGDEQCQTAREAAGLPPLQQMAL